MGKGGEADVPDLDFVREELDAIAAQVVALRKGRDINQAAFARKAGLARKTVIDLEAGLTEPSLTTLKRVAAALDVPLIQLLDGSGQVVASIDPAEDRKKLLKIAKIVGPVPGPEHDG